MTTATGYFSKSGSPIVKIRVWGLSPDLAREFDAIIDTGFTGFLSMPLVQAFPLGLILFGTTNVVLADGSTAFRLTAYGTAEIGPDSRSGVIILEWKSAEVLLGMDFLNRFQKTLMVFGEDAIGKGVKVVLLDNQAVAQALQAAGVAAATAPAIPAPATEAAPPTAAPAEPAASPPSIAEQGNRLKVP